MSDGQKWATPEFMQKLAATVERVRTVYHEANGRPLEKPPVPCPMCGAESTLYACAWGRTQYGSKDHVHFACKACGFRIMQ